MPLPHERQTQPRFDGAYRSGDAAELLFADDGTLVWDEEPGTWVVNNDVLRVRAGDRDGEGAIGINAVYLLCMTGEGSTRRTQFVLDFIAPA